ncbi:MAG: hypothetical protein IPG64_26130 [Haliea sp.]|nr:hypothetical protein [Haliea sp.]
MGDNRQQAASPGGGKTRPCSEESNLNPISVAGSIGPYLHGKQMTEADIARMKAHEPLPDYYLNSTARVAKLHEQGLEAAWLFPDPGRPL